MNDYARSGPIEEMVDAALNLYGLQGNVIVLVFELHRKLAEVCVSIALGTGYLAVRSVDF